MSKQDINKMGKEVADKVGLERNYFFALRRNNLECFNYMKEFHPNDLAVAYVKYNEHRMDVNNRACEIYYELEDEGLLYEFGRLLVEKGVYKDYRNYFNSYKTIFKPEGVKTFSSLLLLIESNKIYEESEYGKKVS